jgi:hypothetical protein
MPKERTDMERAIGQLILSVQQSWNDEAGLPEADESMAVMRRCHDLLQAAKAGYLADLLKGRTIPRYICGLWLGTHPHARRQVEIVAAAMENMVK